jgi:hypothetical protein
LDCLAAVTAIQFPSGTRDLEIALNGVSVSIQPYRAFLSRPEDALKLSDDEIGGIFTITPDSRIWDFSPMRLGSRKDRRAIGEIAG